MRGNFILRVLSLPLDSDDANLIVSYKAGLANSFPLLMCAPVSAR